jgi:hypothetical protein
MIPEITAKHEDKEEMEIWDNIESNITISDAKELLSTTEQQMEG